MCHGCLQICFYLVLTLLISVKAFVPQKRLSVTSGSYQPWVPKKLYSTSAQSEIDSSLSSSSSSPSTTTTVVGSPPPSPPPTTGSSTNKPECICGFCGSTFASRNALFKHMRSDPVCAPKAGLSAPLVKHSIALRFSYLPYNNNNNNVSETGGDDNILQQETVTNKETTTSSGSSINNRTQHDRIPEADVAGSILRECLLNSLTNLLGTNHSLELISSTQTTVASLRHICIGQEPGVAAANDVLAIHLKASPLTNDQWEQLSQDTAKALLQHTTNQQLRLNVRLVALHPDIRFHAEQSCTQQVYHYLLPISWLPGGEQWETWWLEDCERRIDVQDGNGSGGVGGTHVDRFVGSPPSDVMRRLSSILRLAESEALLNRKIQRRHLQPTNNDQGKTTIGSRVEEEGHVETTDGIENTNGMTNTETPEEPIDTIGTIPSTSTRYAAGRFGALANKVPRPWHNLADPNLQGNASPNHEPVWRVLDRVRVKKFLRHRRGRLNGDGEDEALAMIEFRGDGFVQQQIRRIMGTALGVVHGYLPPDVFDVVTQPDTVTKTPLAPPGRLYLANARFHFVEQDRAGRHVFHDKRVIVTTDETEAVQSVQRSLLQRLDCSRVASEEAEWLDNLESCAQRTMTFGQTKLESDHNHDYPSKSALNSAPTEYHRTLRLLREIVQNGAWPKTSRARSSIIRPESTHNENAGSFTIVNPKFQDGIYKNGIGSEPLPRANARFPELVEAVFELEESLSGRTRGRQKMNSDGGTETISNRRLSSHCAVNCNAQFTPHVDSGRGSGQSLSMIVGLGDYVGGEIVVEGQFNAIRYEPLDFDGWKLRHWTNKYQGERFSLVWFTPEI